MEMDRLKRNLKAKMYLNTTIPPLQIPTIDPYLTLNLWEELNDMGYTSSENTSSNNSVETIESPRFEGSIQSQEEKTRERQLSPISEIHMNPHPLSAPLKTETAKELKSNS
jgi:hypothetical protein